MNNNMDNTMIKRPGVLLKVIGWFLLACMAFSPSALAVDPPTMYDYTALPPFVDQSVKPNILIMLDNSGSMNEYVYRNQPFNSNNDYYGYFTSEYKYDYTGSYFEINDENGDWCGKFLNYLTMRRIDVTRKVLFGGYMHSAVGTGRQTLTVEAAPRNYRGEDDYIHEVTFDDLENVTISDVSPYNNDNSFELNNDGELVVNGPDGDNFDTVVMKDPDYKYDLKHDFYEYSEDSYRIGGVMQEFGRDANWGNMWFVEDGGIDERPQGGEIENEVGSIVQFSNLITDMRNKLADTWTPLAESYYVAMHHFKNEGVDTSLNFRQNAAAHQHDPFDDSEWCAKNFVLILTEGLSTRDSNIPDPPDKPYKNYAGAGSSDDRSPSFFIDDEDGSNYSDDCGRWDDDSVCGTEEASGGTDFLKDMAYYARANNLRDDVEGHTHIIPYIVFAFEEDDNAKNLLKETARQGGWRRQINDNVPGLIWKDGESVLADGYESKDDVVPDNFFEAKGGRELETALRNAILGMLERAASGTAAAVVTPDGRSEGEGSVVQSYFQPSRFEGDREISWSGYMHSLWIDRCGNLREDSSGDRTLDHATDKIVKYEYFDDEGTMVTQYDPVLENGALVCPGYDPDSGGEPFDIQDLESIFEAGKVLWDQEPENRDIYTSVGGGMIDFSLDEVEAFEAFSPYLGVNDASVDNAYNLDHLGASTDERAETLVDYIRGTDKDGVLRNRTIAIEEGGVEKVWKLGNIVSSTPVVVGGAVEQYDLIYQDSSYRDYRRDQRDRETMVYVGANDGMLHAFTHGKYDRENMRFDRPDNPDDPLGEEKQSLGTEAWAYIPKALLPHLKWLADPGYAHVFYADLQPKVFDAKIRNGGDDWGTFLLLGLNKGGKRIYINKDGDEEIIYPGYSLIDITDPRNPELIWEKSYEGSGLTTSIPAVFKVGDKWFAAFGSGPNDDAGKTDYKGHSDQTGTMYIIDLADGTDLLSIETGTDNAFLNSPVAYDRFLNFDVDGVYFGETYLDGGVWKGKIHKIAISSEDEDPTYPETTGSWSHSVLFESPGPVTAGINMRADPDNNAMLFFGTGRYMAQEDKQDSEQQYMFGIKDPLYDENNAGTSVDFNELFKANPIDVTEGGYVYENGMLFTKDAEGNNDGTGTFDELVGYARNHYQGWYRDLDTFNGFPSERIVSRPSVIGGTLLVPTFVPVDDVCEPMGESNVLALYYQTGTGFRRHVLSPDESPGSIDGRAITAIKFKQSVIGAPAASIAHHGTDIGILQLDTAQTFIFEYDPDLQRSRITGWRDR